MNAKIQIVLIITCALLFGFVSASNEEIPFKSTGSFLKEPSDFMAKQTVVSVITPTGSLIIDCRHENPKTHVSLLFTQLLEKPFLDITKNENIVQLGQVFMLNEVSIDDDGYYMCARKDGKGKGRIVVEVFVMEEENIYSGFSSLKHAFEKQAVEEIESFVKPSDHDRTRTNIDGPSGTDQEQHRMNIIQQEHVTIPQDIGGSINHVILDNVSSLANMTQSSHVSSFTQDHLPTQNVVDNVTSSHKETAGSASSFTQDHLTTQNVLDYMTSSHKETAGSASSFTQDHLTTQNVLDHMTSSHKVTAGNASTFTEDHLTTQNVVDHVTSSHKETAGNASSFPQDHLTTQNVVDHVTSSHKETAGNASSFPQDQLTTQNVLDHMTSSHNETADNASSFTQDYLTTQNVLDHMTSSHNETACHVSSFKQDHLTTQNVLHHMTSSHNETACHVSSFKQDHLTTQKALDHVTSTSHNGFDDLISMTNMTSGHVTAVAYQTTGHVSYMAQIALDHVTAVTKVTSSHVSSFITGFVMKCVRSTSAAFMLAIAVLINNTS